MSTTTKEITGYKWDSQEAFSVDESAVRLALSLPINDDVITERAIGEKTNDFGGPIFWYCGQHPQLIATLGAPEVFTINVETYDVPE